MKKNKYLVLGLAFFSILSCDKNEDFEDVRNPKPVISIDQKSVTVNEDSEVTFTVTIDREIANPVDLKLEYAGGTGSFRDYVVADFGKLTFDAHETDISEGGFGKGYIGHVIVFPAHAKTATFKIKPIKDAFYENQEVANITFKSTGNMLATVDPASANLAVTIKDVVSTDIGAQLVWDQNTTDIHGTIVPGAYIGADNNEHNYSDYDFDMYILDSGMNDVSGFAGATGSSPEFAEMSGAEPDGDYYVYVELWSAGSAPKSTFNHDLKVHLTKYGTWGTTINIPTTSADSFADFVAVITKTGNNYVVTDYNTSAVLASGKKAAIKNAVQKLRMNKRR